jgi:hypothetical protein
MLQCNMKRMIRENPRMCARNVALQQILGLRT